MDGWRDKNQIEEAILKTDRSGQIGFDEHDDLANALNLEWAPPVYVLDHQGIVLSVERLVDEKDFRRPCGTGLILISKGALSKLS